MADLKAGTWSGAVSYGLMMKRRGFNREHAHQFTRVEDTGSLVKNLSMLKRNRAFDKYLGTTNQRGNA